MTATTAMPSRTPAPIVPGIVETPARTSLLSILRAALVSFILLTILTGLLYPLAITLLAKTAFRNQAEGSLIDKNGRPTTDESAAIGSSLIGQSFDQPQYFWSRPSATNSSDAAPQPQPYNAAASSGSNIGPSAIADTVKSRVDALHQADPDNTAPIPVDLVTASGSGLDPAESVAAANYQVARIARVRHADPNQLRTLIAQNTASPSLGFLGEKTVNILQLNLALDQLAPYTPPAPSTAPAPAATKP